jgi:hypothetical protein
VEANGQLSHLAPGTACGPVSSITGAGGGVGVGARRGPCKSHTTRREQLPGQLNAGDRSLTLVIPTPGVTRVADAWSSGLLRKVAKAYPRKQLHVVVDNYGSHKHPKVNARGWPANPRVSLHFTPTSGSWPTSSRSSSGSCQRTVVAEASGRDQAVAHGEQRGTPCPPHSGNRGGWGSCRIGPLVFRARRVRWSLYA